jgi:UDP-N-acetylglucosamine--N-acetylmuramyl-(pentapeptide) pyrophosphoryl-undecaprenol N-acetylglucosamine transferase
VFGSGLGHAARISEISDMLKRPGDEFTYSSFEEGLDYLRSHGYHPLHSPAIDLKWSSEGGFSSHDSFVGFPRAILTFMKQIGYESDVISRTNPNVIVSDSRLSPIFAAKAKSVPVVTLLNQFKVLFPARFRGKHLSNFYERIAGNMLGLFWSLSDEVLMSDLPPPYTIGEANISGTNVSNIVRYVGFTSKISVSQDSVLKVKNALGFGSRKLIFIQISGPNATKKRFSDCVVEAAKELSRRFDVVVSLGYPSGSNEPKKLAGGSWLFEWCPVKDELFVMSDSIVARAGHGTIGQCINLGTPAVLVPIFNHSEQQANADKYQKLGLGLELRSERLNTKRLVDSVNSVLEDSSFRKQCDKVRAISSQFDGIGGVVRVVQSYL